MSFEDFAPVRCSWVTVIASDEDGSATKSSVGNCSAFNVEAPMSDMGAGCNLLPPALGSDGIRPADFSRSDALLPFETRVLRRRGSG